jgi:RNA polymerase sigma-70 factor (ECF subfamily)
MSLSAPPDAVERELLRAVQGGDDYLFQELVRRHDRLVLSTALRLLRNREEAEDAAQEVFRRVHHGIASYDRSRPFVPWIYKITLNVCYSHLRRQARRREVSIEELQPRFDEEGRHVSDELLVVPDLEERLAARELAQRAEEIIAELPEEYGTAVWMHDVAGISAATLTEVLRLSLPALKSRLRRGRLAVRKRLLESLADAKSESPGPAMPGRAPLRRGVTCREVVIHLLDDYLEGRLKAEDRQRFEEHIRACDRCGPFVEGYRRVVKGLSRLPEPPIPPEMVQVTLAFVRESLESGRFLNRNWAAGLTAAFGRRMRRLLRA